MRKAVHRKQRDGCSGWKERGRYTDPPRPPTALGPGVPIEPTEPSTLEQSLKTPL